MEPREALALCRASSGAPDGRLNVRLYSRDGALREVWTFHGRRQDGGEVDETVETRAAARLGTE